jgi:tetratricopeptide (TPR) repeat protein
MTFDELLTQVLDLLQRQGRLSYHALKARWQLDNDLIEALKDELIYAQRVATDEDDRVLVWSGDSPPAGTPASTHDREPLSYTPPHLAAKILISRSALEGERKQVTVLFCDLAQVGSDNAALGKAWYVLARADPWTGQFMQGIQHCRQAIAVLERAPGLWWLGQSYWWLASMYSWTGVWEAALESYAKAETIGVSLGDPRLQTYAACSSGWVHGAIGDWETGITACQRGIELSPDPLNTAFALGFLGYVYVEEGDAVSAIAVLEPAVQRMQQFHVRQMEGWFTTYLGEAYFLQGANDKAHDLVSHGLALAQDARFLQGVGWAQRTLGRIALARQSFPEADGHLHDALRTFTAMQARLEVARTHLDLAALAHAIGSQGTTAAHLHQAYELFTTLRVPRYVERTTHLATTMGVHLPDRRQVGTGHDGFLS